MSHVLALPATESDANFNIEWRGSDLGSGIQSFSVLVSDNGGAYSPFQTDTLATSATLAGQPGHTYSFYSVARDFVDNREAGKTVPEASTTILSDTIPPATTVTENPAPNGAGWNQSDVTVSLSAADNLGGSGVKEISYSVTGARAVPSTMVAGNAATIRIVGEGVSTITFFATDIAGNIETAKTLTVKIDMTPPQVTVTASSPTLWPPDGKLVSEILSGTMTDVLSGIDPNSATFRIVDGRAVMRLQVLQKKCPAGSADDEMRTAQKLVRLKGQSGFFRLPTDIQILLQFKMFH